MKINDERAQWFRPVRVFRLAIHTEKDFRGNGTFHGWGVNCEEGAGTFTSAIVEFPDGKVELVYPEFLEFIDPLEIPEAGN